MADAGLNGTIANYTAIYNSGKVFLNWTAKNKSADCLYIVERSLDGKVYGVSRYKEGLVLLLNFSIHGWIKHHQNGYAFTE